MSAGWRESRGIVERIIVEGNLVLLTPTSLGNGDSDGLTDMPLLTDALDGSALLTGTSIAGALRNYLRERSLNYGTSEESQYKDSTGRLNVPLPIVTQLFGSLEDDGAQSCLIVDDALGYWEKDGKVFTTVQSELRDGVRIKGTTRTAFVDDKGKGSKFDLELLEAGMKFKLRFELLITQAQEEIRDKLISAFATALQGFENKEIYLGRRKRRGYGECKAKDWSVRYHNLKKKNGLLSWLGTDKAKLKDVQTDEINESQGASITEALKIACNLKNEIQADDNRTYFELGACFALDGSMLIRSGSKLSNVNEKGQPDTVHLHSKRKDKGYMPVVSGTSLAGVLRHRAVKICNTLKANSGESFVENIFGVDMEKLKERNENKGTDEQPFASRLEVKETFIENTSDLVQTRVKIDRFTGGAFEGALFDAAPVFAKDDKQALAITLKLRSPKCCEIGLLLLLLKDLWTGDLAIGGESSVGRGRLKGVSASLHNRKNNNSSWKISLKETDKIEMKLVEGNLPDSKTEPQFLNSLVGKLKVELDKNNAHN